MLFKIGAYLRFLRESHNQHGIHSPFVYDFITKCLYNRELNADIQSLKMDLKPLYSPESTALTNKQIKLLLRIIGYFNPEWLLNFRPNNDLVAGTLKSYQEGEIFNLTSSKNTKEPGDNLLISQYHEFSEIFSEVFQSGFQSKMKKPFCLFFLNKNHLNKGLKEFLEPALHSFSSQSLLILEGIHNSKEKEALWTEIKNLDRVSVTVDLFFWGIIFLRKGQAKQHFKIRV